MFLIYFMYNKYLTVRNTEQSTNLSNEKNNNLNLLGISLA